MTIETEDALRAALHRARSWIATDPAVDDDPYSILIEVDCALSLPSSGEQRDAVIEACASAIEARVKRIQISESGHTKEVPVSDRDDFAAFVRALKSIPAEKEKA